MEKPSQYDYRYEYCRPDDYVYEDADVVEVKPFVAVYNEAYLETIPKKRKVKRRIVVSSTK
jgi:hypothetical protein